MSMLTPEQWKTTIINSIGIPLSDDLVAAAGQFDINWARYDTYDDIDPTGEWRYKAVLVAMLDALVARASANVDTSDGGGQSEQWSQYYDHLFAMRKAEQDALAAVVKRFAGAAGIQAGTMDAYSLTPVLPGYVDPASPVFLGDPRYYPIVPGRKVNF